MANKKNTTPPKKNITPPKTTTVVKPTQMPANGSKRVNIITALLIAFCGILIYSNTINHSFVLDDFSVIAENKITRGGTDSLGAIFHSGYREGNYSVEDNLYRPLTKAMFAIEYDQMGGQKYFAKPDSTPKLSHWINILLYGGLCAFIFLSLLNFFPKNYYLALVTTLLFTFHPLHTEVVANIKSRDEILTLFFLIASLRCAKNYADTDKLFWIPVTGIFYFLALLTKESAITYLALLPVSMYFLTKQPWKKIAITTGAMLAITLLYLYIHKSVIGGIGLPQASIPLADNSINVPGSTQLQRSMTAIHILGMYLKLMFIPHPLSCDYSFNTIPFVKTPAHAGFLLSFIIHTALLVLAIRGFKKKSVISYGILFYFITISIVSNVFPKTLIGTNMAERLVFMPSLGFCLVIGYLVSILLKTENWMPSSFSQVIQKKAILWLFLLPVLGVFTIKTYTRNKDWKNVSTLFNADIKTVPNSVHMLLYHAGMMTNVDSLAIKTPEARLKTLMEAEKDLVKAVNMLDEFPNVHSNLGRIYKEVAEYYIAGGNGTEAANFYNKAIVQYKRTIELNAKDPTTFNNYATCYFALGKYDSAEVYFKKAIEITPICYDDALANLGSVYGMYGVALKSQGKMEESVKMFYLSIEMFNKALECNKENIQAYQFIGVTYTNLGDTIKAKPYIQKYQEMLQQKNQRLNNLK
jgi:Tfp pilus assembly protein PilF